MKKRIALLMAVVMLLICATPAYAAETKTTEISLEVDPSLESYEIVIPAAVEIDPAEKWGACEVELCNVNLLWSDSVEVRLKPVSATENGFYLINTENPELKIQYVISDLPDENGKGSIGEYDGKDTSHLPEGIDDFFYMKVDKNENYGCFAVVALVVGDYPGGGKYTDTWTFTVSCS